MACNALNLQPGLFINTTAWSTAPTTSQGAKPSRLRHPRFRSPDLLGRRTFQSRWIRPGSTCFSAQTTTWPC